MNIVTKFNRAITHKIPEVMESEMLKGLRDEFEIWCRFPTKNRHRKKQNERVQAVGTQCALRFETVGSLFV